jgi:hypothetical protein
MICKKCRKKELEAERARLQVNQLKLLLTAAMKHKGEQREKQLAIVMLFADIGGEEWINRIPDSFSANTAGELCLQRSLPASPVNSTAVSDATINQRPPGLKIHRCVNRKYFRSGELNETKTLLQHAEYELCKGRERLARIVRGPEGWRAVKLSQTSNFGLPISPVGMNRYRDVRKWVLENLVEQES